jgi:TrmH family RNA methyltransferase
LSPLFTGCGGELGLDGVRALRERAERDRTGRFFVEGIRFVATADDSGHQLEGLVAAPSMLRSAVGQMILRRRKKSGVPVLSVSADEFRQLSLLGEPQGLGAVLRQKWSPARALVSPRRDALWVALEEVRSPGNLGTLLRTADAAGADGLVCLSSRVDPFDPTTVRATMGSLLTQKLCRATTAELRALNPHGELLVVGAAPDGERDFRSLSYRRPVILMLGSERHGLSQEQRRLCDAVVRIPMRGRCDSLNLAVAASLLLYEVFGQRHPARRG